MRLSPRAGAALTICAGLLLIFLGLAGQLLKAPTLAIGIALAATLLGVRRTRGDWLTIDLMDIWLFSFTFLFGLELYFTQEAVAREFGAEILVTVEGFITGAFGATLIGYSIVAGNPGSTRSTKALSRPQKVRAYSWRPTMSLPLSVVALVAATTCLAASFVFSAAEPASLFTQGRAERTLHDPGGILSQVERTAITVLPVLLVYLSKRYRLPKLGRLLSLAISTACLIVLLAIGTRFYLGFAVVGVLYFALDRFSHVRSRKRFWIISAGIALLFVLQSVMLFSRSQGGLSGLLRKEEYGSKNETIRSSVRAEGMLRINALIVDSKPYWRESKPPENSFILYWWIPRKVWNNKPTGAGYWIPRELDSRRGFDSGHSVAGGFGLPSLIDFGPLWGVPFCILYGCLIGSMQRLIEHDRVSTWRPVSMLAALLPFGVFFMVRSPFTSLIFLMMAWILAVLPIQLIESRARTMTRR